MELSTEFSRLNSVLNGRFGLGPNQMSWLPDVRGYFTRAWNHKSKIDPNSDTRKMLGTSPKEGDYVGTSEDDIFAKHSHALNYSADKNILSDKGAPAIAIEFDHPSNTEEKGGLETRPKNISELYTIKWA